MNDDTAPTVELRIGTSRFALDERDEVLEVADVEPGAAMVDWADAGICDPRGSGGPGGFEALRNALASGEAVAHKSGQATRRVAAPDQEPAAA